MSEPKTPCTPTEVRRMKIRQATFQNAVADERARQDGKWGRNVVGYDRMMVVLGEEFGEVCRAILDCKLDNLEEELVQLGACCSKFYELVEIVERRRLDAMAEAATRARETQQ